MAKSKLWFGLAGGLALSAASGSMGFFAGVLTGIIVAWYYTNLLTHRRT
jgi:Na+/glutamate symporter